MEALLLKQALAAQDIQLQALVTRITRLIYVDRIYLIGYGSNAVLHEGMFETDHYSQHFELLVITQLSGNIDALNVQRIINESKSIDASVTLLLHSKEYVIEALKGNSLFFHELLRSNKLIYQQEGLPGTIDLPDYDRTNEFFSAQLSWYHQQQRAEALTVAASNITEYDTCTVEAWLLNQAMEQICLGLIFVSIGYQPNQSSLDHLFAICRCIDPAIDEAFPAARQDDKDIFDHLAGAAKAMRDQAVIPVHPTDIGLLHRRCSAWIEKAAESIDMQLKKMAAFQH